MKLIYTVLTLRDVYTYRFSSQGTAWLEERRNPLLEKLFKKCVDICETVENVLEHYNDMDYIVS